MSLLSASTSRPVAVSMFTLAAMLFGLVSLSRLDVTLLPDLSYPTATVRTDYVGAAPSEIETLISKPVEEALSLVRGVRRVQSVSRAGQSDVTLELDWGTQMDFAVLDIREKLDPLELPREAARPLVLRVDPASDPILRYGLSGASAAASDPALLKRLRRIAEDSLQKPLEAVAGVAAVKVSGGLEDEIQVDLDLARLARLNLSSDQVIQRLAQENVNLSGGRIDEGSLRYLVRTRNQYASLADMRQLILFSEDDQVIRLGDLAVVTQGHKERDAIIRIEGREAVELAIFREGDGNTVAVADEVRARLEALAENLPADVSLDLLFDQSRFIEASISGVMQAGLLGGVLAVLVLYLFLGDVRATFIIAAAIPVSVLASFILMYGAGLSLNIMSLGGIALAIGLLIDSAIVVLEAIARRLEAGDSRLQAARSGAAQVALAISASTLTTVAVFFPMVFVEGIAGQLFADQALVVSGTLLAALLVALSVIPMLAARDLTPQPARAAPPLQGHNRPRRALSHLRIALLETLPSALLRLPVWALRLISGVFGAVLRPLARRFQAGFSRLEQAYTPALEHALRRRGAILLLAAGLLGLSLLLLPLLGAELLPPLQQGEFRAELRFDAGQPIEHTDSQVRAMQQDLLGHPLLARSYAVSGTGNRLDTDPQSSGENTAVLNLVLAGQAADEESRAMAMMRERLDAIAGLDYRLARPTLFSFATPLEVEISGHDLDMLALAAAQIETAMRGRDRFVDIESSLAPGQPEIQIRFDQARVAALGLTVPDLAERVVQAMQGRVASRYRVRDREIDILVRGDARQRQDIEALRGLIVNPQAATSVPLAAVAEITLGSGPAEIRRIDHQRVAVISADLAHGDLAEAVAELESLLRALPLPSSVSASVVGQNAEMQRSFDSLQFALGLAVFLVYLVMAAQFESLLQPFIILLSVPLAGVGAVLALLLTGSIINVVVLIGLIVLAGIVVNNAIVLIDRINQLRETATSLEAAILAGAAERLRPILMTTLTTILGLLPLALAQGQGAELRAPLAITIIGGLSVATLLTLFVIPVVYSLITPEPAPEPALEPAATGSGHAPD